MSGFHLFEGRFFVALRHTPVTAQKKILSGFQREITMSCGGDQTHEVLPGGSGLFPFPTERSSSQESSQGSSFSNASSETDVQGEGPAELLAAVASNDLDGVVADILPWLAPILLESSSTTYLQDLRRLHPDCDILVLLCAGIHAIASSVEREAAEEILECFCWSSQLDVDDVKKTSETGPTVDEAFIQRLLLAREAFRALHPPRKFKPFFEETDAVRRRFQLELDYIQQLNAQ